MRRWHFQPGWVATAGFLLAAALVCGCGRDGAGARQATAVRSVRDATGREVQIPVQPTRVLSLCTTVTDTLARLGLLDRLAGMDEYSKVVPGTERVAILG